MDPSSEYRRCLLEMDVVGIMRLWSVTNPNHPQPSPDEALIQLHIARVEAKSMPRKAKLYSLDLLFERGFRLIKGKWVYGEPVPEDTGISVGIATNSRIPQVRDRLLKAMKDAYLNEVAKGITDPDIQRTKMLAAREKQRFKLRMA